MFIVTVNCFRNGFQLNTIFHWKKSSNWSCLAGWLLFVMFSFCLVWCGVPLHVPSVESLLGTGILLCYLVRVQILRSCGPSRDSAWNLRKKQDSTLRRLQKCLCSFHPQRLRGRRTDQMKWTHWHSCADVMHFCLGRGRERQDFAAPAGSGI